MLTLLSWLELLHLEVVERVDSAPLRELEQLYIAGADVQSDSVLWFGEQAHPVSSRLRQQPRSRGFDAAGISPPGEVRPPAIHVVSCFLLIFIFRA